MSDNSHSHRHGLHKLHLIVDAVIGGLALITIFFEDKLATIFSHVDIAFHIIIFTLVIIVIGSDLIRAKKSCPKGKS